MHYHEAITSKIKEMLLLWSDRIRNHEKTTSHKNAKVASVLYQECSDMKSLLDHESKTREVERVKNVKVNREILKRIVDVIVLLGKQGLVFRGHKENMAKDADLNNGNFLELLKLLGKYDSILGSHLKKVRTNQANTKAKGRKKKVGRGSKVTFLSKTIQNKLIDIIGNEIVCVIVEYINTAGHIGYINMPLVNIKNDPCNYRKSRRMISYSLQI